MKQVICLAVLLYFSIHTAFAGRNPFTGSGIIRDTLKGDLWVLSIGIAEYNGKDMHIMVKNSEMDAIRFVQFFNSQFIKGVSGDSAVTIRRIHNILLLGNNATREQIIKSLKTIVDSCKPEDYFIFNFAGFCFPLVRGNTQQTWFAPWGVGISDSVRIEQKGISVDQFSQYFALVPANNQLFFTESGPTRDFRKEFIESVVEKNPEAAALSSKNRVLIIPNKFGMDEFQCKAERIEQGPLNYYLTRLPSDRNVFDLFKDREKANKVVYSIRRNEVLCGEASDPYFDIYFERDFLEVLKFMSPAGEEKLRGGQIGGQKPAVQKPVVGRKLALIIASNKFAAAQEWETLNTPLNDAAAVADTLAHQYGYEIISLFNQPKVVINQKLVELSKELKTEDQFVVYFAGHGDYDENLLGDGFIVCSDSKATAQDPTRDSYLSFNSLSRMLNKFPCRQNLVLLDVCFGGTFSEKVVTSVIPDQPGSYNPNESFVNRKLNLRTRRFISSGGKNPVPDRAKELQFRNHSPFAVLLLEALRSKGRNGVLTATQIYANMQDKLPSGPSLGNFGEIQRDSDFLLLVKQD